LVVCSSRAGRASDKEKMLFTRLEAELTCSEWDKSRMQSFELELPEDVVDVGKMFGEEEGNPPSNDD
jgi:hypothetical protein